MRLPGPITLSALLALALVLPAQAYAQGFVPLEQRLSAEQLRATGLDQLTPDQLSLLNALLRDEQAVQAQAVRTELEQEQAARGSSRRDRDRDREPIVSKIVGEFQGWRSGTRFELGNGQTWRVIDTPEYYVPKSKWISSPAVAITPGLIGGWYLQVEGQAPRAKVQKLD
jgi:hypothetical protein